MFYIGIVDKIKEEHKPGIYGRKRLNQEELKMTTNDLILNGIEVVIKNLIFPNIINIALPLVGIGKSIKAIKGRSNKISLQHEIDNQGKRIIIKNSSLDNNYNIDGDKEILYGLFDNIQISSNKAFEKIMKSNGGSTLLIIEKEIANKEYKHYGGSGYFSSGLYTLHPKDNKILIPIKNANDIIGSFILEETIRAYEALGAKSILIEDITEREANIGGKKENISAKANMNAEKKVLRRKEFGAGTFSPERALNDKLFIYDFPNIMSVIEARIHGNQLKEEFTESINLGAGLDIGVLNLFNANLDLKYERIWHFDVEFYNKEN